MKTIVPVKSSFDAPFQFARTSVHERAAQRVDKRAADDHAEHPPELDLEVVGRLGAPTAEVLQLPRAVDRLELALLLAPAETRRAVVLEAHGRLDRPYLGVARALHERHMSIVVAFKLLDVLEAVLPLRGRHDILDNGPDFVDRHLDLCCRRTGDLSHVRSLSQT